MGFGRRKAHSASDVSLSCGKVKETAIVIDKTKREKSKTIRKPENITAVAESVHEAQSTPNHRRSFA